MTSSFGWLALDPEQRRRMMEAVDQFRDETTIDDLGFGGIRDAFSDTLFPGTSTLHTRLRYVLFVPWLLQEASHRDTVVRMQSTFREYEYQLIDALKRGREAEGVFGRDAGRALRRLPSEVYWGMLARWGVFEPGFTARSYFEREQLRREELRAAPSADDPDVHVHLTPTGLDPRLPDPPGKLLKNATFSLRPEDAQYLREAITRTTAGTLLAHLAAHRPENWTDASTAPAGVGDPAIRQGLSPELDVLVDRADRFALTAEGANLLYNLLLAEATGKHHHQGTTLTEVYRDRMDAWFEEAQSVEPLHAQDREAIWLMVTARGRRVSRTTRDFIGTWADAVATAPSAADLFGSADLRQRVVDREREKKGTRARLAPGNQRALDAWTGASGTGRFDYRWRNVRRHLQDLYDAEGGA
ncbi:DUF6361 family protein [Microbacterium sp. A93]|uniref:DUF6361 family protein n=1 Tax=Microbacterium sp. A93 TaxID=3450716 RepID=UPI003F41DA3B